MIGWKAAHHLLGFHFVNVMHGFDRHVRRVRMTPNGKPYVVICGQMHFLTESNRPWDALTFDKEAFVSAMQQRQSKTELKLVS